MVDHNPYISHHGIMGMQWGVRRFQPYPKGHKGGKEVGQAAKASKGEKLREKATIKLTKIDSKIQKRQNVANAQFQKAVKKQNSLFSTQKGIDKAMNKATKAQRRVNSLQYNGEQYYKKISKKLDKMEIKEGKELQNLGKKYIDAVSRNSSGIYNAVITGGSVKRKG